MKLSKAKAFRDDSRRPMKKYYVKRLIFSTPAGRRHMHDNFGVLWKLDTLGPSKVFLWNLAGSDDSQEKPCSSLIGFGMDPSVL